MTEQEIANQQQMRQLEVDFESRMDSLTNKLSEQTQHATLLREELESAKTAAEANLKNKCAEIRKEWANSEKQLTYDHHKKFSLYQQTVVSELQQLQNTLSEEKRIFSDSAEAKDSKILSLQNEFSALNAELNANQQFFEDQLANLIQHKTQLESANTINHRLVCEQKRYISELESELHALKHKPELEAVTLRERKEDISSESLKNQATKSESEFAHITSPPRGRQLGLNLQYGLVSNNTDEMDPKVQTKKHNGENEVEKTSITSDSVSDTEAETVNESAIQLQSTTPSKQLTKEIYSESDSFKTPKKAVSSNSLHDATINIVNATQASTEVATLKDENHYDLVHSTPARKPPPSPLQDISPARKLPSPALPTQHGNIQASSFGPHLHIPPPPTDLEVSDGEMPSSHEDEDYNGRKSSYESRHEHEYAPEPDDLISAEHLSIDSNENYSTTEEQDYAQNIDKGKSYIQSGNDADLNLHNNQTQEPHYTVLTNGQQQLDQPSSNLQNAADNLQQALEDDIEDLSKSQNTNMSRFEQSLSSMSIASNDGTVVNFANAVNRPPSRRILDVWSAFFKNVSRAPISHQTTQNILQRKFFGAILSNEYEEIERILTQHPESSRFTDEDGMSAFHVAVCAGSRDVIALVAGFDDFCINSVDSNGDSPLTVALLEKQRECLTCLLECGASVNVKSKDQSTSLHVAASLGDLALVNLLLSYGADKVLYMLCLCLNLYQ